MPSVDRRRMPRALAAATLCLALGACGSPPPSDRAAGSEPVPGSTSPSRASSVEDGASITPRPSSSPSPSLRASTPAGCEDPHGCYDAPLLVGSFDVEAIPEASGIAASIRNPGVLYLLDDGPGTRSVHAVRLDGQVVGELAIDGLNGVDTEGLAVGACAEASADSCVYVGDIGDNRSRRDAIAVHRFIEPDLARGPPEGPLPADRILLRYPDGPVDAEALLVEHGVPYIVTKQADEADGAGMARLFAAPGFADGTLIDLGPVPVPEPESPLVRTVLGNVVTAADSRPGRVLLRTYDHAVEYLAPDPGASLAQFTVWPVREVPAPLQPQGEAVVYLADGCGYVLAGEMSGDLWLVACGL